MVGANGFEPSTSWSRTRHLNPINALSGVAYGTRSVISPLLVVPNLYLEFQKVIQKLGRPDSESTSRLGEATFGTIRLLTFTSSVEESPPAGRVKNEEAWSPDSTRNGQSGLLPDSRQ